MPKSCVDGKQALLCCLVSHKEMRNIKTEQPALDVTRLVADSNDKLWVI